MRVKRKLASVDYVANDNGVWRPSSMPATVANELLRRLEWRESDTGAELCTGTMRIPLSFLEEGSDD